MAVHPSNVLLPDFHNRLRHTLGAENRNLLSPISMAYLDQLHHLQTPSSFPTAMPANSIDMAPPPPPLLFPDVDQQLACNLANSSRKRGRELHDEQQRQHMSHFQQANAVSTGLRLALDDDTLRNAAPPSTSGRLQDAYLHLHHYRQDMDNYLSSQGEQMRQALDEKRMKFTRVLIAAIDQGVSRRLRDKELEMDKIRRRNLELEEHLKQLSLEAHLWHSKVKNSESILLKLRSNLQAVNLSREREQLQQQQQQQQQSKEGCGDSQADDACSCSSHHDDKVEDAQAQAQALAFKENKELKEQRTCRVCRSSQVSSLVLPCRHLCLCKDCESHLDSCPLCRTPKSGSIQVYMS